MPNATSSLDTIFSEAIDLLDGAKRADYLARACGSDDALRRRVEALVNAHFRANGSFLEHPGATVDSTAAFDPAPDDAVGPEMGTAIGPYTLREQIGEGGMGLVFVAEQTQPVRRKVALKLIKPGMDSRQVVARFEAERQALALMDHPNIAKVLDAGTTREGRPFFVMELVKGEPVTHYCDRNRLNLRQRLELFLQVCAAVQHAHQKGVIHRDLKPSNVLVAVHDVTPVAKVIDFGIAKAVGQSLTDKTLYTAFAQMVGTPLYMSPEQAGQSSLDVDTRTDVYALGVILYELLTGSTPIDPETLRTAGYDELRRIIREVEPPRPSTRMSTLKAEALSTVADKRAADPRRLIGQMRGDLDWVVMKCLEKDRERRYESAGALAADVQRHLDDEPVHARPPSATYRARKFVRRNRGPATAAALVLLAAVAGAGVAAWQAVVADRARRAAVAERDAADRERRRADDEAATAKAVNDFIRTVFAEADPEKNPRGKKVSVEEVLGRAAGRISGEFAGRPVVEAAIRATIGETYLQLGDYGAAAPHLERAAEVRRRELGAEHPDTLDSLGTLALLFFDLGQLDLAEPLLVSTLAVCRRTLGDDHIHTLTNANNLALVYQRRNRTGDAEALFAEVLATFRRLNGEAHPRTLMAMYGLAEVLLLQGRDREAEPLLVKVLETSRRDPGGDNHVTLAALGGLAGVYDARKDRARSEPLHIEALELSRRAMGEDHPQTLIAMTNVASVYQDRGEFVAAEAMFV